MKKVLLILMLCLAVTAAQAIVVENYSFELPGDGKIKGWDMDDGAYYTADSSPAEVPGWEADGTVVDSGVESDWPGSTDGAWSAFMMSGDPSAYNLTDYAIVAGELYLLRVDARNNWTDTGAGTADLMLSLYYDVGGVRTTVASTTAVAMPEEWLTYSLLFAADDVPGSIGNLIGIELQNVSAATNGSWIGLDNVRLDVVPEPATLALLGLGSLIALRRRK